MEEWQSRTALLMGEESLRRLEAAHVAVVGCGGVGAEAAEMIARAGVGRMTLFDADKVSESNINRQIIALHSTVGSDKTAVLGHRLRDINPKLRLNAYNIYVDAANIPSFFVPGSVDCVVDAIDTPEAKAALIAHCIESRTPIVSSLGAGAKFRLEKVELTTLGNTFADPLARILRKKLRSAGVGGYEKLPVAFSSETPCPRAHKEVDNERDKRRTTGTIAYMPAAFGLFLAQYVITKLTETPAAPQNE